MPSVLHVDETDPSTTIDGAPAGWSSRPVSLTARAGDAQSGMAPSGTGGPLTAIRVDGGAPVSAEGDAVETTVIATGIHCVAYYARDAAGNVNDGGLSNGYRNHSPATAQVRIDRKAPALAFANAQDPSDPERIAARVADPLSGLDTTAARSRCRAGSGERFTPLPTERLGRRALSARWDSDAYPAGEYEFRATAYDMAGNSEDHPGAGERRGDAAARTRSRSRPGWSTWSRQARDCSATAGGTWFGGRLLAGAPHAAGGHAGAGDRALRPMAGAGRRRVCDGGPQPGRRPCNGRRRFVPAALPRSEP